jgi:hypothetical protein
LSSVIKMGAMSTANVRQRSPTFANIRHISWYWPWYRVGRP